MFLKNKNIIFKIRRSKVTDYAALSCLLPYILILKKNCFLIFIQNVNNLKHPVIYPLFFFSFIDLN